jgi:hypothetical protein
VGILERQEVALPFHRDPFQQDLRQERRTDSEVFLQKLAAVLPSERLAEVRIHCSIAAAQPVARLERMAVHQIPA